MTINSLNKYSNRKASVIFFVIVALIIPIPLVDYLVNQTAGMGIMKVTLSNSEGYMIETLGIEMEMEKCLEIKRVHNKQNTEEKTSTSEYSGTWNRNVACDPV